MKSSDKDYYSSKVSEIIQLILLNQDVYKQRKSEFLERISSSDLESIKILSLTIKTCITLPESEISIESKLLALRFLQESMLLNNYYMIESVKLTLLPYLKEIATFESENPDLNRGKNYFKKDVSNTTKTIGNSYLRLTLECIKKWAFWYPNDKEYFSLYKDLVDMGVKFPTEETYHKNLSNEPRIPIKSEIFDSSKSNKEELKIQFFEYQNKLKKSKFELGQIANNFQDDLKIMMENMEPIIFSLKSLLKIGLNIERYDGLENFEREYLEESNKKIDSLVSKFNNYLNDQNADFRNFILDFQEFWGNKSGTSAALKKPSHFGNGNINGIPRKNDVLLDLIKNSNFDPLEIEIKESLLESMDKLEFNKDDFLNRIKKNPQENSDLFISKIGDFIKRDDENALSKYLCLKFVQYCSETRINLIMAAISKHILSILEEILLKSIEDQIIYLNGKFSEMSNSTKKTINNFIVLSKECVFCWAKMYPFNPKYKEKPSSFLKLFDKLKESGVIFSTNLLYFKINQLGIDIYPETQIDINQYLIKFDYKINEFIGYLITKHDKKIDFLTDFRSNLKELEKIFSEIHLNLIDKEVKEKLEEIFKFINEFNSRISLLDKKEITIGNFRTKFQKFFKIKKEKTESSQSEISRIDLPFPKFVKTDKLDNPLIDAEIIEKIPENPIKLKVIQKSVTNFISKIPKDRFIKEEEIEALLLDNIFDDETIIIGLKQIFLDKNYDFESKLNALLIVKIMVQSEKDNFLKLINDYLMQTILLLVYKLNLPTNSKDDLDYFKFDFIKLGLECIFVWGKISTYDNFKKSLIFLEDKLIEFPKEFTFFKDYGLFEQKKGEVIQFLKQFDDENDIDNSEIDKLMERFLKVLIKYKKKYLILSVKTSRK